MISMPCRTHCLTDSAERACAETRLPRTWASATATAISSSVMGVNSAGMPAIYSPERFSLTVSTPYLRNMRTVFRISSGPLTMAPKLNSGYGRWGSVSSPRAAGPVVSLPPREVTWAGNLARFDGVPYHHVEARLGGGGADAGRPAHVEIALGDVGTPEDVLLGGRALDLAEAGLIVPGEVGVRLDEAGHEGGAATVHHGHPAHGQRARAPGHAGDAIALHQHLAGVGRGAARVQDPNVREEDVGHGLLPEGDPRAAPR